MTEQTPQRLARLRVDANAIACNWRYFAKLAPKAATAAVVKADGYGLGASTAAHALAKAGARAFFTATTGEALAVRKVLGDGPNVFVLNGPREDDVEAIVGAKLMPVLNSLAQIKVWSGRGRAVLHVDTGMNRLGLGPEELPHASIALKDTTLALVMSHLACAGERAHEMNALQRQRFIDAASLFPSAPMSLAATSGALLGADYHFDLIRPGIGLYGSGGMDADNPTLSTAAIVEAPILQIREVTRGETFGYGATAKAPKNMRAATVAIGYADGYLRSLSGRGYGVLGGAKLPLLGRVSMDLVILDISAAPTARVGDYVEFLGPNAPLDDIAQRAGSLPYEMLTTFAGIVRKAGS